MGHSNRHVMAMIQQSVGQAGAWSLATPVGRATAASTTDSHIFHVVKTLVIASYQGGKF